MRVLKAFAAFGMVCCGVSTIASAQVAPARQGAQPPPPPQFAAVPQMDPKADQPQFRQGIPGGPNPPPERPQIFAEHPGSDAPTREEMNPDTRSVAEPETPSAGGD